MKKVFQKSISFLFLALICFSSIEAEEISQGTWKISITPEGVVNVYKSDVLLISETQCSFKIDDITYLQNELSEISIEENTTYTDNFGSGKHIQITSKTNDNIYTITHNYYLYNDYIFTDFTIESDQVFGTNYMAPIKTDTPVSFLPSDDENKSLYVPFDNDKWIRYRTNNFGAPTTSFEVGAVFNASSYQGLIVGSIEHILWKTGVKTTTSATNTLNTIEVFGGITAKHETSDNLPHGIIEGKSIKSPKIFIGLFDDWRTGLETYADVNAIFAPKLPWDAGKPFLWNSWGVIQTNINYAKSRQVSDWIANNLQNNNFNNDNTVYIDLDSYWDRLSYDQRGYFVPYCESNNQKAGIYWSPFVDWGNNGERNVEGADGYKYKDIYLYADGEMQLIAGAAAVDPTHPATKMRIDYYLNQFKDQGYEFIKLDFMTHGSLEADSHYDPDVYTGIQAYNQGLQYILDVLDNSMFINLSISPLFPANYAHSRRIACDAYTDAEYTLNSLTYGWWLDRVYSYNDGDNVVFKGQDNEGRNRSRVISSVITGIFCIGDDFSSVGDEVAKEKATRLLTNKEINQMARQTKAFRPVKSANGNSAAEMYYETVADTVYVAIFNSTVREKEYELDLETFGIQSGTVHTIRELWRNEYNTSSNSWTESVPRADVKVLKIYPGIDELGINDNLAENVRFYPNPCVDNLMIDSKESLKNIDIYSITGQKIAQFQNPSQSIDLSRLSSGVYYIVATSSSNVIYKSKLIKVNQ